MNNENTDRRTAAETLTLDEMFFFDHAGSSYFPARETLLEGRMKGAKDLAAAEREYREEPAQIVWEIDTNITSHDWEDKEEPERWTYLAILYYNGEVVASLGGIDLAEDPDDNPYKRVICAELWQEFNLQRESMITRGDN